MVALVAIDAHYHRACLDGRVQHFLDAGTAASYTILDEFNQGGVDEPAQKAPQRGPPTCWSRSGPQSTPDDAGDRLALRTAFSRFALTEKDGSAAAEASVDGTRVLAGGTEAVVPDSTSVTTNGGPRRDLDNLEIATSGWELVQVASGGLVVGPAGIEPATERL